MTLWHSILLGIVQGISEFLPISSSGHLVIAERSLELAVADDRVFDVVVHAGTLFALLVYFWKDWVALVKSIFIRDVKSRLMILFLILATIPAGIAGVLLGDWIDDTFRTVSWVGVWLLVTGALLFTAEQYPKDRGKEVTAKKSLLIGCFQAFALLPGISRSGSTIAAGMMLGLSREKAARFSFMMLVPALLGAVTLTFLDFEHTTVRIAYFTPYIIGMITAAVVSLLLIHLMLGFVKTHSLKVFAWYCFLVGGTITVVSFL